jgi:S-adenosylmethionine decarboxylase
MREGRHIKVQLYGVRFELLKDVELMKTFLTSLVAAAGMRPLGIAHVYDIKEQLFEQGEEPDPNEPEGVTGVVVLSTSHVAVHTWPHRGYLILDLYSCRQFSSRPVVKMVQSFFGFVRYKIWDLSHSLDVPLPPEEE